MGLAPPASAAARGRVVRQRGATPLIGAASIQPLLAILSGGLVGFTLGLIGGGGSIMATPLLLYVVSLQPHVAIGTGALAVSANAFINFVGHARRGNVRWRAAILFAVVDAAAGSVVGKSYNGGRLLFLLAILMIVIGVLMVRRGAKPAAPTRMEALRPAFAVASAGSVSLLAGFFGIGGDHLIVPGLLFSTGMPMIFAVGSSLLAVGAFGLTTATSYALSGLIDWTIAGEYVVGGVVGGFIELRLACCLAEQKATLNRVFAGLVFAVAFYMLYRNAAAFGLVR